MSLLVNQYIRAIFRILEEGSIETPAYNNALSIKHTIERLHKTGGLSDTDIKIINLIAQGYSYAEVASIVGMSRKKVSDIFKNSCSKIAFILGGEFTNVGFLNVAYKKYGLDETKVKKFLEKITK